MTPCIFKQLPFPVWKDSFRKKRKKSSQTLPNVHWIAFCVECASLLYNSYQYIFTTPSPWKDPPFYKIPINICSQKAQKDATELSLVVIALSAPSGQRVAPILDTSPLNRTNCGQQKIGKKFISKVIYLRAQTMNCSTIQGSQSSWGDDMSPVRLAAEWPQYISNINIRYVPTK